MSDWPEGLIPIAVHNSDIQKFKECREQWNWVSDLREGLKPIETPYPLSFGSAIHAALEVWYDPSLPPEIRHGSKTRLGLEVQAVHAFKRHMVANKNRYLVLTGNVALNEEQQAEYDHHLDLGYGMLVHYFEWIRKHDFDAGLEPVATEVPFEFKVYDTHDEQVLMLGEWSKPYVVVFRGRIDLLVRDSDGRLWILDHKTTSRMEDVLEFLEMDEQMGSYILGYTLSEGEQIAGALYSQILKGYPKPPEENKTVRLGRRFSVNKQQHTSYEVYKQTLIDAGEDLELYEEILHYLKVEGPTYVRRIPVPRNTTELRNIADRIVMEVSDMLDPDIRIYPSPTKWNCKYCSFRQACFAKMEGQDFEWVLNMTTTPEKRTNA